MNPKDNRIKVLLRDIFRHMLSYLRWIFLCLIILYLFSGIYSVSSNEIGVLQRFG